MDRAYADWITGSLFLPPPAQLASLAPTKDKLDLAYDYDTLGIPVRSNVPSLAASSRRMTDRRSAMYPRQGLPPSRQRPLPVVLLHPASPRTFRSVNTWLDGTDLTTDPNRPPSVDGSYLGKSSGESSCGSSCHSSQSECTHSTCSTHSASAKTKSSQSGTSGIETNSESVASIYAGRLLRTRDLKGTSLNTEWLGGESGDLLPSPPAKLESALVKYERPVPNAAARKDRHEARHANPDWLSESPVIKASSNRYRKPSQRMNANTVEAAFESRSRLSKPASPLSDTVETSDETSASMNWRPIWPPRARLAVASTKLDTKTSNLRAGTVASSSSSGDSVSGRGTVIDFAKAHFFPTQTQALDDISVGAPKSSREMGDSLVGYGSKTAISKVPTLTKQHITPNQTIPKGPSGIYDDAESTATASSGFSTIIKRNKQKLDDIASIERQSTHESSRSGQKSSTLSGTDEPTRMPQEIDMRVTRLTHRTTGLPGDNNVDYLYKVKPPQRLASGGTSSDLTSSDEKTITDGTQHGKASISRAQTDKHTTDLANRKTGSRALKTKHERANHGSRLLQTRVDNDSTQDDEEPAETSRRTDSKHSSSDEPDDSNGSLTDTESSALSDSDASSVTQRGKASTRLDELQAERNKSERGGRKSSRQRDVEKAPVSILKRRPVAANEKTAGEDTSAQVGASGSGETPQSAGIAPPSLDSTQPIDTSTLGMADDAPEDDEERSPVVEVGRDKLPSWLSNISTPPQADPNELFLPGAEIALAAQQVTTFSIGKKTRNLAWDYTRDLEDCNRHRIQYWLRLLDLLSSFIDLVANSAKEGNLPSDYRRFREMLRNPVSGYIKLAGIVVDRSTLMAKFSLQAKEAAKEVGTMSMSVWSDIDRFPRLSNRLTKRYMLLASAGVADVEYHSWLTVLSRYTSGNAAHGLCSGNKCIPGEHLCCD